MKAAFIEETHGGGSPAHLVSDAEFTHQLEGRGVRFTNEMIEALARHTVQVEMARHAAGFGRSLKHVHLVTVLCGTVCGGEAHGSSPDHGDTTHADNS